MATNATADDQKTGGPVRVGLVAEGDRLRSLAAAIDACVLLQPLGQVGSPRSAGLPDVRWFDDPRVLLSQPGLEALITARSTRQDLELATMAAAQGLHVWRLPPLAPSFAEAAEVVRSARQLSTIYRVASWWEYVVDHVWRELAWPEEFHPLFSELRVSTPSPDPQIQAGQASGVLADRAYPLLEGLLALRGLPETVSGVVRACRVHPAGGPEDTVVALLRYGGDGVAMICVAWDLPPPEQRLSHHGQSLTASFTDQEVLLQDAHGAIIDRRPLPGGFVAAELARFAELVRTAGRDRAAAPLERHLAASALLESIYLSARTGQPESPRKLYQVQRWPEPRS